MSLNKFRAFVYSGGEGLFFEFFFFFSYQDILLDLKRGPNVLGVSAKILVFFDCRARNQILFVVKFTQG